MNISLDSYSTAVKSLWSGKCTVTQQKSETNEATGREDVNEVILYKDIPCRISFGSDEPTSMSANASFTTQGVTLLIGKDINIPEGSKITVTQNGAIGVYSRSGKPAVYLTHQQISLELFKGWA